MAIKERGGEKYSESLVDLLVATIGSGRSVRKFRSILLERGLKHRKEESIRATLSKLKSKGYLNSSNQGWSITENGKKHIKKINLLNYIPSPFDKNSSTKTIVAFDIPEKNRVLRNWLRNQIKIFGYKMLQQSLWIGPGPLPASFLKRLEDLRIRQNVKTFRIQKRK